MKVEDVKALQELIDEAFEKMIDGSFPDDFDWGVEYDKLASQTKEKVLNDKERSILL